VAAAVATRQDLVVRMRRSLSTGSIVQWPTDRFTGRRGDQLVGWIVRDIATVSLSSMWFVPLLPRERRAGNISGVYVLVRLFTVPG